MTSFRNLRSISEGLTEYARALSELVEDVPVGGEPQVASAGLSGEDTDSDEIESTGMPSLYGSDSDSDSSSGSDSVSGEDESRQEYDLQSEVSDEDVEDAIVEQLWNDGRAYNSLMEDREKFKTGGLTTLPGDVIKNYLEIRQEKDDEDKGEFDQTVEEELESEAADDDKYKEFEFEDNCEYIKKMYTIDKAFENTTLREDYDIKDKVGSKRAAAEEAERAEELDEDHDSAVHEIERQMDVLRNLLLAVELCDHQEKHPSMINLALQNIKEGLEMDKCFKESSPLEIMFDDEDNYGNFEALQLRVTALYEAINYVVSLDPDRLASVRNEYEALAEIRFEQKSTEKIIKPIAFERLVREIGQDFITDLSYTPEAFDALQTAAEQYLVDLFEKANFLVVSNKRTKIETTDIQAVRYIRGERF